MDNCDKIVTMFQRYRESWIGASREDQRRSKSGPGIHNAMDTTVKCWQVCNLHDKCRPLSGTPTATIPGDMQLKVLGLKNGSGDG